MMMDDRVRKPKEDPQDTTSFEGADSEDSVVVMRRKNRARRGAYKRFIADHHEGWKVFNVSVFLISVVLALGSYKVIQYNRANGKDCAGLRGIHWTGMLLHWLNAMICLLNLCKLETKVCFFNAICTIGIIEMIVIAWLQVGYFNSQEFYCITKAPFMYFWLMTQIMFLYVAISVSCCYFGRKYCAEDADESEESSDEEDVFVKQTGQTVEP